MGLQSTGMVEVRAAPGVFSVPSARSVSVLFTRAVSHYDALADTWNEARDARRYCGDSPVVCHPPCRGWGRLSHFANVCPGELDLARFAVAQVRRVGGVLEHPAWSRLWVDQSLPLPGVRDAFGGWTLPIDQIWFGHRARKATWLYICGLEPMEAPLLPLSFDAPVKPVERMGRAERERTPVALASWLVDLASRCRL